MFGFFKDKQLLEQKKMLWQNFFGSKDIREILEARRDDYMFMSQRYKDVNERIILKLLDIYSMSVTIMNSWDYKVSLDKEWLNYLWQDNKVLRGIYAEHLPVQKLSRSFDDFINPPYGWEIALKDWN